MPDAAGLECALSRIYGTLRHEYAPDPSAPPPDTVAQQVLDALAATPLTAEELRCVIGCDARSCLELLSELTLRAASSASSMDDTRLLPRSARTIAAWCTIGRNTSNGRETMGCHA